MTGDTLLWLFLLVLFFGGLAAIFRFARSSHLRLIRYGTHVDGEVCTRVLGVVTIRTTTLENVLRAEVDYAMRRMRRISRVVLVGANKTVPCRGYGYATSEDGVLATRINRFLEGRTSDQSLAISQNVGGAWLLFVLLLPFVVVGGWGLGVGVKMEVLRYHALPSLREPARDVVYENGKFVEVPRSTAVPEEFPEGAYYPEFCSFLPVTSDRGEFSVHGVTTMEMTPARKYVVAKMKNSGWVPYDGVMQSDGETFTYERDGIHLTYVFYVSTVNPGDGIACWVTWGNK